VTAIHYASGAGLFTPEGLAAAYREFGQSLNPTALRVAKQSGEIVRKEAVHRFTQRGVGRGLFGRKDTGAYKLINARSEIKGDLVRLEVELKGFAALQEKGGHTNPPRRGGRIFAKKPGHFLCLKVAGGISNTFLRRGAAAKTAAGGVFRASVPHPGATIKRVPFATESILSAQSEIRAIWEREITKFRNHGVAIIESGVA
jgi:hypothetical protein